MIKNNYWSRKRVLITGHSGFKGSWLTLLLSELGADVFGVSDEKGQDKSFHHKVISNKNISNEYWIDIRNQSAYSEVLRKIVPEVIFHFAAQSQVAVGYMHPTLTFDTNVIGTSVVLEAAKEIDGLESLIIATSDKVYDRRFQKRPSQENDKLGGVDPYSQSKVLTEAIVQNYMNAFPNVPNFKNIGVVRAGNVIGGGDRADYRLVPDIFRTIERNSKLKIRMPSAVRPWQHVLDCLSGYLTLAESIGRASIENSEKVFNFGPEISNAVSVLELVQKIDSDLLSRYNIKINYEFENVKYYEVPNLELDITKSKNFLKWTPKMNLEETISLTCDWYVAEFRNGDLLNLSRRQIEGYLNRTK